MRNTFLMGLSALALTTFFVAPAAAAELGGGFSINGGATVVSDYRFRGISQTDKRFAVQGSLTLSHSTGLYATVWGSSIDDYVADFSDQEIDLIVGYKHDFSGTVLDVGLLYYYYPNAESVFPGYNSDFIEPYISVSHTFGPVTAKASAAYAPKQKALTQCQPFFCGKEDNFYLAGDLSVAIPGTPVTATGHLGHTWGPSWIGIGDEYTDWSLGLSYTTGPLTLGVSYVDTDGTLFAPSGRNISKAGVVGSIGVSF